MRMQKGCVSHTHKPPGTGKEGIIKLMQTIVCLDIETTGLSPDNDSIIEIGAIKFSGTRVIAEYETLINPSRPINQYISNLTGISNAMVMNAPMLSDKLREFVDFVGDAPILGQNVGFDLSFFHKVGALKQNQAIDTYELASVLLPTAPRYALSALASHLGVVQQNVHRALADARATMDVYHKLMDILHTLPDELIVEIVSQSEKLGWAGELPFKAVLKERMEDRPYEIYKAQKATDKLFSFAKATPAIPLEPVQFLKPLDVEELASTLEPGGAFSRHNLDFEHRSQQVQVLKSVAEALNKGNHLMVEAGTGTGKSLAYLIPAAQWALQNGERVVVSTNTIALQDQLINKDLPDLIEALDSDLRTAVLKGRSNYLCPRKLNALRKRGPENADELRILAKILVWLHQGGSGDRAEINLNGPIERMIWARLSAEDENCRIETCLRQMGGRCPFYKARMEAESAHILVVNHALLLADAATENRVLPAYNYLIIDEAHHIEAATTDAMAFRLYAHDIKRLVRELGSHEHGLLGRAWALAQDGLRPSDLAQLSVTIGKITDIAVRFDTYMSQYFKALDYVLEELRDGRPLGTYPQQVRILPSLRALPMWFEVEVAWDDAHTALNSLTSHLKVIREILHSINSNDDEDAEDLMGALGTMSQTIAEIGEKLEQLTMTPDDNQIYWVELDPLQGRLTLQSAPLHIGTLMEKHLWHEKASVILTSATLTTHGEFDYLKRRLNAQDADEMTIDSPFDYEHAVMIYLPTDIPEPNDSYGHQKITEDTIIRLARVTGGRMLVLFTSYAQLRKTSQSISPALAKLDISVFEQGEGASASALLESFKESDRAVLLGTRAFWEGVDVPGEALSALVIVKLPFDVPSDPIIAARAESFENPFAEYNLPEAILRFRQGFGRLIRTQSDRGVVVMLDKRLVSKQYGRLFMESLPNCHIQCSSIANLPEHASKWLGN